MDLFAAAFPNAHWTKILDLNDRTAKGRAFRLLEHGNWVPGEQLADVAGFDYRTRCSRLRDLGVPVESRASENSACHLFRIPRTFLLVLEEKRREKRRTA